jgi:mRNA interferase RelE/StbE
MHVNYHRQFEKDLEKYASPEQIQEIFDFVDALEKSTNIRDIQNIKKLSGFREFYRYRLGEYRIGFSLESNTVRLERFLHRKDIYKKYP